MGYRVGQTVKSRIREVDPDKGKVALTCREGSGRDRGEDGTPLDELIVGEEVEGKVVSVMDYGVFVDIGAQSDAFLHISEASDEYVKDGDDLSAMFPVGESIKCSI